MLSLYRFDPSKNVGSWSHTQTVQVKAGDLTSGSEVIWLDLENPTVEEEELVFKRLFPIHPLSLEDITRLRREPDEPPHFPKVEEFPEYLFVIVNPLSDNCRAILSGQASPEAFPEMRPVTQLSAILTRKLLITHHYTPLEGIEQLKRFLNRHEAHSERGPDYLFHLILDGGVDEYADLLERFDDMLDKLEARVLEQTSPDLLLRLTRLRRLVVMLRKTVAREAEMLSRMMRGEFELIDDREAVYYRNVYDHLIRFGELIDGSRELLGDLVQTHLSVVSNRLNQIMKVLTMISTVVLPMTLIAGIYGMNFKFMPELDWHFGYPLAVFLMLTTGIGASLLFRWRRWL